MTMSIERPSTKTVYEHKITVALGDNRLENIIVESTKPHISFTEAWDLVKNYYGLNLRVQIVAQEDISKRRYNIMYMIDGTFTFGIFFVDQLILSRPDAEALVLKSKGFPLAIKGYTR